MTIPLQNNVPFKALEMAHQLESQGENLAFIALLTPSPPKPRIVKAKRYTHYAKLLSRFYNLLIFHYQTRRPLIPAIYNAISNRILWRYRTFHRFIPIEIHRYRRYVHAFVNALLSYEPKAYQGRITCFLHDNYFQNHEEGLNEWHDLAIGGLDVQYVPGNIFTMWNKPNVRVLADKLTTSINDAQKNSR